MTSAIEIDGLRKPRAGAFRSERIRRRHHSAVPEVDGSQACDDNQPPGRMRTTRTGAPPARQKGARDDLRRAASES